MSLPNHATTTVICNYYRPACDFHALHFGDFHDQFLHKRGKVAQHLLQVDKLPLLLAKATPNLVDAPWCIDCG